MNLQKGSFFWKRADFLEMPFLILFEFAKGGFFWKAILALPQAFDTSAS